MRRQLAWSELTIIGVIGGGFSACIALAVRLGASVDNLLNFFGGAMGSGLAVIATLWLESHRRDLALRQVMDQLVITADVGLRVQTISPEMVRPLLVTFQQSVQAFEASKLGLSIQDPVHQYGFHAALFWLQNALDTAKSGLEKCNSGEITEEDLLQQSKKPLLGAVSSIEDFLQLPGLPKSPSDNLQSHKKRVELEVKLADIRSNTPPPI